MSQTGPTIWHFLKLFLFLLLCDRQKYFLHCWTGNCTSLANAELSITFGLMTLWQRGARLFCTAQCRRSGPGPRLRHRRFCVQTLLPKSGPAVSMICIFPIWLEKCCAKKNVAQRKMFPKNRAKVWQWSWVLGLYNSEFSPSICKLYSAIISPVGKVFDKIMLE